MEHRPDDEDVRQMHARGGVGIVADEDVAGTDRAVVLTQHVAHGVEEAAEMAGIGEPLGERAAGRVQPLP